MPDDFLKMIILKFDICSNNKLTYRQVGSLFFAVKFRLINQIRRGYYEI